MTLPTSRVRRLEPCIFCSEPVRHKREHGWTRWFLKRWEGQGPFTRERNGEPIQRRDGTPQRTQKMPPVKVPVCGFGSANDCNAWLNDTFENPAKEAIRDAMDRGKVIRGPEIEHFARWWVKTLLLLHHPRAHDSFPRSGPSRWQLPDDMLATMRWTGEMPADLSLWIAVVHAGSPGGHLDGLRRIHLPLTSHDGGEPRDGQRTVLDVSLADGRSASLQLVYHPSCDFEHPFEQAGLATLLWPDPPEELDLAAHPALDEIGHRQFGRLFVGGAMACHLQAGTRLHLHAYNDGEFSPLPCFDRGCRRRDGVVDRARGSMQT